VTNRGHSLIYYLLSLHTLPHCIRCPHCPHCSFGELKADPAKAKKPHHRPKGASEFARQYMQGFYSAIEDDLLEADGKGPSAAADAKFAHK